MSTLDRIQVVGFKSIRNLDLNLQSLNILIGANGVGKSNFISLFKLLNQIVNENLRVYVGSSGGSDQILHHGRKTTSRIGIRLTFGANAYKVILIPDSEDLLLFDEEVVYFHDKRYRDPYEHGLGKGHQETRLNRAVQGNIRIARYVLESLRSWQVYHFHDTSDSSKIKQTNDVDDNRFFRPDASNLAAYLYFLKQRANTHYNTIVGAVRLVAPFFDDFILEPLRLNPNKIQLEWREKGSEAYFNASSLSDGTLRFISLSTLLLQPTLPTTILIDEPELGLHPYAIGVLSDMIRSASTRTQLIVATQSPTFVNQFAPENIIVVERDGKESNFKKLDIENLEIWLGEYGLGELWEKNVIGGRPKP